MSDPLTLQFGPWQPDLQNVPVQIPFYPSLADPIPAADCLNVYYSDGAYRSIPSPAAIGPALGFQALNAFSWYDNSTGEEYVFAAGAGQISALIGGVWEALPIGAEPLFNLTLTQGTVTAIQGLINASLVAALQSGGGISTVVGYGAGNAGSLTPSVDVSGHTITQLVLLVRSPSRTGNIELLYSTPGLGASYFRQLAIGSLNLLSAAATYSSSGGGSLWTWGGVSSTAIVSGNTYPIAIT